jgi:hypothetical protein
VIDYPKEDYRKQNCGNDRKDVHVTNSSGMSICRLVPRMKYGVSVGENRSQIGQTTEYLNVNSDDGNFVESKLVTHMFFLLCESFYSALSF